MNPMSIFHAADLRFPFILLKAALQQKNQTLGLSNADFNYELSD